MKPLTDVMQQVPNFKKKALENSKELVKNLTNDELEIIKAQHEGTLIGAMDTNQLIELSKRIVKTANAKLGLTAVTDEDLELNIELIYGDLANFKGNTDKIILQALKCGLNGDFSSDGKVFFSSSAFVIWVKKFITDKKMPVLAKFQHNKAIAEREAVKDLPSIAEQRKVMEAIIEDHKAILEKDIDHAFMFDCGVLYDNLGRAEMFQYSDNEIMEIAILVCEKYPKLNSIQLLKKAKHQAWIKYILGLIIPKEDELPLVKKNARSTVKMVY
jgi:hypothetical protein